MTHDAANWLEYNRANWDERVPVHVGSEFYDVAGFRAGRQTLRDFEIAEVGDVTGRRLLHLQCHFGLDTLSWARRSAIVTGLDFSAPAIEQARALAAEIGAPDARFVVSDVYDAVAALGGATYDIVYTGLGAIYWLPDVDRWARVVADLVAPGGMLYLAEFHPVTGMFDEDGKSVAYDYFDGPRVWDEPGTYTDGGGVTEHTVTVGREHPLGEVVTAIAGAGLRIEYLHEFGTTLFPRFPGLERFGDQGYRFPPGHPSMPMMYSIRAHRD